MPYLLGGPASAQELSDPIKIALFDWTSVNLNAKILGGILEKLGYTVEYPTADYLSSLTTGLTNGDLTVALEFWDTTAGEAMKASDATGQTERLGALGPKAKEEWWYPMYMKEKCPGLPNWQALMEPACAEAFSTPDTAPNGRYLGGPVTWEGFDDERVVALEAALHRRACRHRRRDVRRARFRLSAEGADHAVGLLAALGAGQIRGRVDRIPRTYARVLHRPEMGHESRRPYDCGKPHGEIWKYSWAGMKDKWPVAYKVAKAYTIDAAELNKLSGEVDLEGKSIEDVAAAWIDANEAKWKAWAQ